MRRFLDCFRELFPFLVGNVSLLGMLGSALCSRHLDPGVKLIPSAFCVIVVVYARVGVIIQLTDLERKEESLHYKWTMDIESGTSHPTERAILKKPNKPSRSRSPCCDHNTSQTSHRRRSQSVSWLLQPWPSACQLWSSHHLPEADMIMNECIKADSDFSFKSNYDGLKNAIFYYLGCTYRKVNLCWSYFAALCWSGRIWGHCFIRCWYVYCRTVINYIHSCRRHTVISITLSCCCCRVQTFLGICPLNVLTVASIVVIVVIWGGEWGILNVICDIN